MPKMKTTNQAPAPKATSAKVNYAVGSGSRPNGGKLVIPSSAPSNAKNHRK